MLLKTTQGNAKRGERKKPEQAQPSLGTRACHMAHDALPTASQQSQDEAQASTLWTGTLGIRTESSAPRHITTKWQTWGLNPGFTSLPPKPNVH